MDFGGYLERNNEKIVADIDKESQFYYWVRITAYRSLCKFVIQ